MKKSKLIISLLILMIISAFSVKVVFADKASIGKVNAVTVNLREEASSSSKILVQLGEDTEVEILGTSGDWYQVEYDGISGYISKDYLDIVEEGDTLALVDEEEDTTTETSNDTEENVANETSTAVETEESTETTDEPEETVEEETTETVDTTATEFTLSKDAEIRVNPSFSSSKTTAIAEGSTVTVVDEINKWIKITDGNVTGWAVRQNIQ